MALASSHKIIVDTGPLVAFVRAAEASHAWVTARFRELSPPFFTCEPVLTETLFLLSRESDGSRCFFDLLASGLLQVDFTILAEQHALSKLIGKYKDPPMSLAHACLVRMSERAPESAVFTLDAHFSVYRRNGRQRIPVIMP